MVAKTCPLAQRAAQLVKIDYKDLPAIITIEVRASIKLIGVNGYGRLLLLYCRML